jgi:hypothetical protein
VALADPRDGLDRPHARRPGEDRNIVLNAILGLLALVVVSGRLAVSPF